MSSLRRRLPGDVSKRPRAVARATAKALRQAMARRRLEEYREAKRLEEALYDVLAAD